MKKTTYLASLGITIVLLAGLVVKVVNQSKKTDDLSAKLDAKISENTKLQSELSQANQKDADLDEKVSQLEFKLSQIREKADSFKQTEQTVLAVVQQEAKSRKSHFDGRNANPNEYRHYYSEISAIDASACPEDFRDAWRDFLESVDFKIRHPILSGSKGSSESPAGKRRDLEALAAKYGVVFKAP